ncbi:GNAT family N-acetyltransferase [Kribbella sp. NPDC050124]|uniref:GNAT family N-acetyltransferase n=1 Tax=Kribbella sp. NPDC050124 TaxID=3364114 RepID=UPI0037AFC8AF
MLTLIRPAGPIEAVIPPAGVVLRAPSPDDTLELGRLYFASYEPGAASATEDEAIDDINLSFAGEYGPLNLTISQLAGVGEQLVGALLVVERAPWPDTPDCPFVIELFTAPTHRRLGIASALLTHAVAVSSSPLALRVAPTNTVARGLYERLGFQEG